MYARVTHFRILPGKLVEFSTAVQSLIPEIQGQKGFRGMLVVHTQTSDPDRSGSVVAVGDAGGP